MMDFEQSGILSGLYHGEHGAPDLQLQPVAGGTAGGAGNLGDLADRGDLAVLGLDPADLAVLDLDDPVVRDLDPADLTWSVPVFVAGRWFWIQRLDWRRDPPEVI